jgi:hypothetical protein
MKKKILHPCPLPSELAQFKANSAYFEAIINIDIDSFISWVGLYKEC